MEIKFRNTPRNLKALLSLLGLLLITNCKGNLGLPETNNNNLLPNQLVNVPLVASNPEKIIVFCGDPGVGKSSLCNSIFQESIFKSGFSEGIGVTREKQEYIYENIKYIDTPGLSDIKLREQAAKEIEKALKENNNYKIIFVAMLNTGRIRASDLTTINTVCDAIKTPFEYGVIFNQVPAKDAKKINLEGIGNYLQDLHRRPSSTIIITRDENMEGEDNAFLTSNSENRLKLIDFIAKLQANRIDEKQVQTIDVRTYDKLKEEMELNLNLVLKKLEEEKIRTQEALKNSEKTQQTHKEQLTNLTHQLQTEIKKSDSLQTRITKWDEEKIKETKQYKQPPYVSASNYWQAFVPANLLNKGAWNSGGYAPQWFEIDLKQETNISSISMVVDQEPRTGYTRHVVTGGLSNNPTNVLCVFEGNTYDGQTLSSSFPTASIRYIRVNTTQSPSWVAWKDVKLS